MRHHPIQATIAVFLVVAMGAACGSPALEVAPSPVLDAPTATAGATPSQGPLPTAVPAASAAASVAP
jgi:hypothetical protein